MVRSGRLATGGGGASFSSCSLDVGVAVEEGGDEEWGEWEEPATDSFDSFTKGADTVDTSPTH